MYLKRIVLHGFKSFADRTEFDFGPGITVVVGPNGCGKSNILDALRWVLGEQSARSLRGHKMLDVIFAGSRSRKPANAATVELTFDNRTRFLTRDEPEVSLSRTLYRSGESEYRINGEICRLKDIRHLLLDTGVGVDAYSVIEQGRVDLLLQANPLERREIFEEAAGISRYKVQRIEAQRKLERTQQNLLRLNDVIDELEKRLRSVKLAATKARKWQEFDARLRERRATFSLAEYHELTCSRQALETKTTSLTDALQAQRAELAGHDADAAACERSRQQLDEQIQAIESRLAALQSEHSALAERIAQGQRRREDLVAARDRRIAQGTDFEQRLADLAQRIAEESAAHQTLVEAVQRNAEIVAGLRQATTDAAGRRDAARQELEAAKTAAFEAVRRSTVLSSEQNSLVAQRDRLMAQSDRHSARRAQLEGEQAGVAQSRDAAAAQTEALDHRAGELSDQLRAVEAQLSEIESRGSELERRIGQGKEARSAVLSRLELLEDLERRLEGIDQGTQAVLQWSVPDGEKRNVAGLVAELLTVNDPRVWVLQAVLATFENHVVVTDTYAFLAELARREALPGPVRIFALDRIPRETTRETYEDAPGFVARAVDWVTCAPEYRPLAEHLLGRVIIVDVVERALALAANAPDGYVFVTLDGRTVSASGRITVGAAQATPGLMSRKAEIRQLHARRDEVETQLEQAQREKNALEAQVSDIQLRRGELLNSIADVQKQHAEARAGLSRLDSEMLRVQREAAIVESELHAARRGLMEIQEQQHRLETEALTIGQSQQEHASRIDELTARLAELSAAFERVSAELTEALVAAGRSTEKQTASEESLAALHSALASLERERGQARLEADEAARQIEAVEAEAAAAQTRQVECRQQADVARGEAMQSREQRQQVLQQLELCGTHSRETQERIRQTESELSECAVTQRELEVRQENLVTRVRDELSLDLRERYAGYQHAEQDWNAIRTEIDELREKLSRLGNVNLDALAELEELSPRFDNLIAQRTDLLAATQKLQTLIAELDQESRQRFAAAFDQIRTNFQDLFRKLFGGGKADIVLEDPEQPLECGIDIIARPPGKEPQSITLLSGGEKTMTAVALLMAVFKSKPSPFAFLDEVDAALDEANTERFNTLIQEFLSHSQFVVITHSKRTMQCGDVLYGVTMEEPGVSKHVSVRFEDRVPTPNVA